MTFYRHLCWVITWELSVLWGFLKRPELDVLWFPNFKKKTITREGKIRKQISIQLWFELWKLSPFGIKQNDILFSSLPLSLQFSSPPDIITKVRCKLVIFHFLKVLIKYYNHFTWSKQPMSLTHDINKHIVFLVKIIN